MKYLIHLLRFFLGVTFIISGMIKLNDPMGFAFKLEDYFAPNVLNLTFLEPYALALAILVCIAEIVLGVTLLLGYKKKLTLWLLLAMLVFFGFLTFYSAYYNKVTDCGCFGDAIKFTPWQSFTKDMVLLAVALVLFFWGQAYIKPLAKERTLLCLIILSVVGCGIFVYYVYNYLPVVDFRPYKIGANIPQGLLQPSGKITYHMTVILDGKETNITNNTGQIPKNSNGEYAKVIKMTSETPKPLMHDFYIEDKDRNSYFDEFMDKEKLILVVAYRIDRTDEAAFSKIKELTDRAMKEGYTVIGLTSQLDLAQNIIKKYELNFDFYFNDGTTLKTMIRANPGVVWLNKGTIVDKKHYNSL